MRLAESRSEAGPYRTCHDLVPTGRGRYWFGLHSGCRCAVVGDGGQCGCAYSSDPAALGWGLTSKLCDVERHARRRLCPLARNGSVSSAQTQSAVARSRSRPLGYQKSRHGFYKQCRIVVEELCCRWLLPQWRDRALDHSVRHALPRLLMEWAHAVCVCHCSGAC